MAERTAEVIRQFSCRWCGAQVTHAREVTVHNALTVEIHGEQLLHVNPACRRFVEDDPKQFLLDHGLALAGPRSGGAAN